MRLPVIRRLTAAAVAVLAGAGMAAAATPAASAAPANLPTASISRSIFLAGTSNGVATVPAGPNGQDGVRNIVLDPGHYTFTYSFTGGPGGVTASASETIDIPAKGTYSWACLISGLDNSAGLSNYGTECSIANADETKTIAALPTDNLENDIFLPQGTWTWTSTLVPGSDVS